MKLGLSQVAMSIKDFFGENAVKIKARKTKFVQRLSSLDGRRFLQTVVFGFIENPDASLNDLSQVCLDLGVDITPQGLDQRINEKAVVFLKEMFVKAMDKFKNKIPRLSVKLCGLYADSRGTAPPTTDGQLYTLLSGSIHFLAPRSWDRWRRDSHSRGLTPRIRVEPLCEAGQLSMEVWYCQP